MGKLPGINNLTKKRVDLLAEDEVIDVKEEKKNKRSSKVSVSKKEPFKKEKTYGDLDCKKMAAMVSVDFKLAVVLYCVENDIKMVDLIKQELVNVLDTGSLCLDGVEYNTNNMKTEINAPVYGMFPSVLKKNINLFAKANGYTEGYIIAQTIAKKIGWKKKI